MAFFLLLFFISFLGPKFELYGYLSPTTLLVMIKFIVWLDETVYTFALLAFWLVIFGIGVRIRGTVTVIGCLRIGQLVGC